MRPGAVVRRVVVGPVLDGLANNCAVVLDVGGHDGSVGGASRPRRVVLDLDRSGLVAARAQGMAGVEASALAMPLPDLSVDVAVCCDVLPCLARDDAALLYAEIARVLKDGGRLLLTEVDDGFRLPLVDNETLYAGWGAITKGSSYERLAGLLDAAGLTIVEHRPFYGAISRFAYAVLFVRSWPRRGSRVKQRLWQSIAGLERWWSPVPQAHLIVAGVRR